MAIDVQYKCSNLEEFRLWIPQPRTPDELAQAVKEISTRDWFRIVITHGNEKRPEKPHHD